MKHTATRAALFVALAASGWAEAPALKFEVATIKPNSADDHRVMLQVQPGGMLHASGVSLMMLITQAYNVRDFQVLGGPKWLATDRFDIVAKAEGAPDRIPFEQFRPMLAALIEDRFQLKIHRETKEMPEYALVVTKSGAKLQANTIEAGPQNGRKCGWGAGSLWPRRFRWRC